MPELLSIVLPAKNESEGLGAILPGLVKMYVDAEIIVIDDNSTDDTKKVCQENNVRVISHPYSMGNGAAIKTGAREASGDIIVFMDADGQHDYQDIAALLKKMESGYDMVVGARSVDTHASFLRRIGNYTYNKLASLMTGFKIEDLTSGFRAVRTRHFRRFLYLLPNGFSYPTTSTMAFFRSGLPVAYVPIKAGVRNGDSHISLFKDGIKFFVIIMKVGALFSPMRLFLPVSSVLFLTGLAYYSYTYVSTGRFTNMSALLFTTSIIIFLIGLVSEQVSSLHYKGIEESQRRKTRE